MHSIGRNYDPLQTDSPNKMTRVSSCRLTGVNNNTLEVMEEEMDRIDIYPDSSETIHIFLIKEHSAMDSLTCSFFLTFSEYY